MVIFKESVKSLKWFLIIVGVFGLSPTLKALGNLGKVAPLETIMIIISIFITLGILLIGFTFEKLIKTKSELIINFFLFNIIWIVITALYYFSSSKNTAIFVLAGLTVAINLVIITSIKRLSK